MTRTRVAIFGSTGSIGTQALDVIATHNDRLEVVALAANVSFDIVAAQAKEFGVSELAMGDENAATLLRKEGFPSVTGGREALCALSELETVDIVLNAMTGFAGLAITVAALKAGKKVALANKESLVAGGEYVTGLAEAGQIIPVDSEHSAIFQCLLGENDAEVARMWITASGGPFLGFTREQLSKASVEDALAHPTWSMGQKISIDSATLMNKGLEIIEAHHLFGVSYDDISVVVQPQSCIHSMVEYVDGSVKAHMGVTDMRIPIQFALSYPERWESHIIPVDFTKLGHLDFMPADIQTFRCLELAIKAGRTGKTMPTVMNAANEVAVATFLARDCSFLDIESTVEHVMSEHLPVELISFEQIESIDIWAREVAKDFLKKP